MTINEHIKYWLNSAAHDLDTAEHLFKSGKYDWCLFIGHLVLEKTLKALFVFKNDNKVPPKIHNLVRLAKLSKIGLTQEQEIFLGDVNDFNLQTRYPDYKQQFYKKCTKSFTDEYFIKIKEQHKWLKSQIK
jgi:HEPN domain-containing protein